PPEPTGKTSAGEDVVDALVSRCIVWARRIDPGDKVIAGGAETGSRINGEIRRQRLAKLMVRRAGQFDIFGRSRQHVEVAHEDESLGTGRLRQADFGQAGKAASFQRIVEDALAQEPYLGEALHRVAMIEMGAIEADRTQRRFNQRLEGSALEIQHFQAAAALQKQVARKAYGRARQDHVAEL